MKVIARMGMGLKLFCGKLAILLGARRYQKELAIQNNTIQRMIDDSNRTGNDIRRITENLQNNNHQIFQLQQATAQKEYPHLFDYIGFESLFRGAESEIQLRQKTYLPYFIGQDRPVVDIGCGRGEFLSLLQSQGVISIGIDTNKDFVRHCRQRGLDVHNIDALTYLYQAEDSSLGGVSMNQVIEHLPFNELVEIVAMIYAKLAPGAYLTAETINPQSLIVYTESFFLDPTHDHMLHPFTVRFLFEQFGFRGTTIQYLSPVDSRFNMCIPDPVQADCQNITNQTFETANQLLFGHREYVVIGRKPLLESNLE